MEFVFCQNQLKRTNESPATESLKVPTWILLITFYVRTFCHIGSAPTKCIAIPIRISALGANDGFSHVVPALTPSHTNISPSRNRKIRRESCDCYIA